MECSEGLVALMMDFEDPDIMLVFTVRDGGLKYTLCRKWRKESRDDIGLFLFTWKGVPMRIDQSKTITKEGFTITDDVE